MSAVGLVYTNPDGVRIRVRNCNELLLISNNPNVDQTTNDSENIHAIIPGSIEIKDTNGNNNLENNPLSTEKAPQTGDTGMIVFYFEVLLASLLVVAITTKRKRKTCDK